MTTINIDQRPVGLIPIHFDVPSHYLPLDTFINTATHTHSLVESLNHFCFDGKLQYRLLILPPDEGSFLSKLGIILLAGASAVCYYTQSDDGKAFIKGLTKHEPSYWHGKGGEYLRDILSPEVKVDSHGANGKP